MTKKRLFTLMESLNPDMNISYDDMIDLMIDDVKYVRKYIDNVKNITSEDLYHILAHNPQSYELLKDYADKILEPQDISDLIAHFPNGAGKYFIEKQKNVSSGYDIKIGVHHIMESIMNDKTKIKNFSHLFQNETWLDFNEKGIKVLLKEIPELKNYDFFNKAIKLHNQGKISISDRPRIV